MANNNIQSFCGLAPNETFQVFVHENRTFERCFIWGALTLPSHIFFAIATAYHLGRTRSLVSRGPRCLLARLACLLTALLVLSDATEVILSYVLKQHVPPVYLLAKVSSFVAWAVCFLQQRRIRGLTVHDKRQSRVTMAFLLPVLVSASFQLQFVDQTMRIHHLSLQKLPVNYIGVFVSFSLSLLLFLLCTIISLSQIKVILPYDRLSEERTDSTNDSIFLGPSESAGNLISKLCFWWSDKLLRKGYKHQLEVAQDLFLMPDTINTKEMKKILTEKIKSERQKEQLQNTLSSGGAGDESKAGRRRTSLFNVLGGCFGKLFFSLAVLKLLMNVLVLVQPVLVNLLVNFVSDKHEPITHGYYYACAFLLTNLASVVLQLHYRYVQRFTMANILAEFPPGAPPFLVKEGRNKLDLQKFSLFSGHFKKGSCYQIILD